MDDWTLQVATLLLDDDIIGLQELKRVLIAVIVFKLRHYHSIIIP